MSWKELLERVLHAVTLTIGIMLGNGTIPGAPQAPPRPERPFDPIPPAPPAAPPSPVLPCPPKSDPLAALGRLALSGGSCSATIIGPRRADGKWDVLSAAHCFRGGRKTATVHLRDGRSLPVRLTAIDNVSDVAWCATEVVESLPFLLLAKAPAQKGDAIWHSGFGRDKPANVERGVIDTGADNLGRWWGRIKVSPGDSGCAVIHAQTGEVVGCLYGFSGPQSLGGSCTAAWKIRPGAVAPPT